MSKKITIELDHMKASLVIYYYDKAFAATGGRIPQIIQKITEEIRSKLFDEGRNDVRQDN